MSAVLRKFTYSGSDYEVRASPTEDGVRVRAYRDGEPANGYTYSVTIGTAYDLEILRDESALSHLIEAAERDVCDEAWERLQRRLAENDT